MTTHRTDSSARGAIIIHVAIAILALIAFSAFIVDYGIMWIARSQAQAAADGGAHAGAVELTQGGTTADAITAAQSFAQRIPVWGATTALADIVVTTPPCPASAGGGAPCVRVDVLRGTPDRAGGAHTNTLPTFFAQLVGVTSQGVRATAMAQSAAGNAVNCLKPWFVPDLWEEHSSPANNTFDLGVDIYRRPDPGPGTGYTSAQIGMAITLTEGDPHDTVAPGNYYEADLTGGGGGTTEYKAAITGCVDTVKEINPGDTCTGATDPNCVNLLNGRRPQANIDAAQTLIDADSGAHIVSGKVVGSCAPNCVGYEGQGSPRVVPIAMFDPGDYRIQSGPSGNITLPIVNIMAIFVDSVVSNGPNKGNINGILIGDPNALLVSGAGSAGPNGSFLKIVRLVQ
jgi:Flp pilus assembly protein TadG